LTDSTWHDTQFRETAILVLGVLIVAGGAIFPFQRKHSRLLSAWMSLKSWLFAIPIFFLALGLGGSWPLLILTGVAIFGAKEFFQITGMYHRSYFVWLVYFGIVSLAVCIHNQMMALYNLIPMIILGSITLVPLLRNSYDKMVQYMALSLFNFAFLGWGFLHVGWILHCPNGYLILIYIFLLTEMSDNINLAIGSFVGKRKILSNITPKRSLEGLFGSFILTTALAYGMRHLLPDRSEPFWIASALVAFLIGSLGDLVLSVIRKDLGARDVDTFVFGRTTILQLMDRIIFVGPIYYYVMRFLFRVYQ